MSYPSNIYELLFEISQNYVQARRENFVEHPIAQMLRRKSKEILQKVVSFDGIIIKGSPGQSQWTPYPWIAIINRKETKGAQDGFYVVYLFSEDMKRIYLTLSQGVSVPIQEYGRKRAFEIIKNRADRIRMLKSLDGFYGDNNINLGNYGKGPDYEKSIIFFKEYSSLSLVDNDQLQKDLVELVTFYNELLMEGNTLTSDTEFVGKYKNKAGEGKRILTTHYTYERDSKLISDFKVNYLERHNELRCNACNFSFEDKYGPRGSGYIEIHHLKPVSEMKPGQETSFDDLVLLCSNCHRMIHRKMPYLSMNELTTILQS